MVSGEVRNAVSGETRLEGELRTYREACPSASAASSSRTSAGLWRRRPAARWTSTLSEGYPAVWNHEALYQRITAQLGADAPQLLEKPVLAAEDFSFYQQYVPEPSFFLGTGDTPQLHAPDFAFDDEAVLPRGVEFLKKLLLLPEAPVSGRTSASGRRCRSLRLTPNDL